MGGASGFTCYDFLGSLINVCNLTFASNPNYCHQWADGVNTWRALTPRTIEKGGMCQCANGYERTWGGFCRERCGDGKFLSHNGINNYGCDDGNYDNGDGCDSNCWVESGYICLNVFKGASFCYKCNYNGVVDSGEECDVGADTAACTYCRNVTVPTCGNGKIEYSFTGASWEQCDDGNILSGDGCSGACLIEEFYYCSNKLALNRNVCLAKCGNGWVEVSEQCDDGNEIDGDGCGALDCTIEPMYDCNN